MLVEPHGERFLRTTRGRMVALLRGGPRTVDELAQALGVSDSAVRVHLTSLERDGLVRRGGRRRGPSKPSYAYELTAEAERLFPKAYERTLDALLDVLGEQLPAGTLAAILRETGSLVGAQTSVPTGGEYGDGSRLGHAAAVFQDLGGLPRLDQRDGAVYLSSDSCPLAGLVARHPQVCDLAEALLTQVVGAPVQQVCPRGTPPRCAFRMPAVG